MIQAGFPESSVLQRTLAFFVVLTLIAGYGGSQISSEFNAEDFLPQEVEVVKQFNYYQDNFGASAGEVSFIYISGDNLATNAVFQAIDNTQEQLLIDDTYVSLSLIHI